jgi:hypothetical protein
MRVNILLSIVLCALLFEAVPAGGADKFLTPSITVSEEYTDNVFEVPTGKRGEFITRVLPGFTLKYGAPFWDWDISYSFDYRHYARESKEDEFTHNALVKGNLRVIDNFLYLDLNDNYSRVSLDVARDVTKESLFLNQTDQNIATVSPYLLWRPGAKNSLRTGYRYTDTRYWDSAGIDKIAHGAFADLTHEVTGKFSLTAGYVFTRLESRPVDYNKHDVNGGFRYEYADKSFLYGQIGNSWQRFSSGSNVSYLFWNAGVTHDLGFAVATIETKVEITEDPLSVSTKETSYSGKIDRTLQRGHIGFAASYAEYVFTETGIRDRNNLSFNGTGSYEIVPDLTANISATGEQFTRKIATDYPYRLTTIAGLSLALKNDLALNVNYTYVVYRYSLRDGTGANEINRAAVEVKKIFR